jgi:hypothetical protein
MPADAGIFVSKDFKKTDRREYQHATADGQQGIGATTLCLPEISRKPEQEQATQNQE